MLFPRGGGVLSVNRRERPIYLPGSRAGAEHVGHVSAQDDSLGMGGTARTAMTLSISRACYAATVRSANSPCGLPQFEARPPLIAVGLRELGAEQEDLGRVIDPYQNDDQRARSAVG
jgi:hypothetical protein